MITKNILIFCLLFPFLLKGQEDNKWGFGLQLADLNGVASYHPHYTSLPNFCFSGYAVALYAINSKIKFNTRLGFCLNDFNRKQTNLVFDRNIDPQDGSISTSKLNENHTAGSIEIPSLFNYSLFNKRYTIRGFQANLRRTIGIDTTIQSASGKHEKAIIKDVNPALNASVLIGIGYAFETTENANIRASALKMEFHRSHS